MNKQRKLWIALILIGFLGQLAWTIENMYFNVFVYNTITTDVSIIARMVSLSAITATLTTILMGTISDRAGKRKPFICIGYILWGISLLAFAFLSVENIAKLFPTASAVALGGWLAVIMDCVMTFFGSTSNDAAFNAWVTDSVDKGSRTKVESVLATLPLISMLVVFGLLDGFTQAGRWDSFFIICGSLVTIGGVIGIFVVDEPAITKTDDGSSFWQNLTYGFRKEVILNNKELYLALVCMLVFNCAVQVFMPYIIIYIQNYLGIANYALVLGIVLLGSSVISVLMGRIISILGNDNFYIPAIVLFAVGLLLMFITRKMVPVIIAGLIMMSGYLILTTIINSTVRNYTPASKAGQLQGVRMIFGVMIPMIVGSNLGAAVIANSGSTYVELGEVKQVPTPAIWLTSAIIAVLVLIPYFRLKKIQDDKANQHVDLLTDFGQQFDEDNVLPEYPRPQLRRNSYLNLNGLWDYAIVEDGEGFVNFQGKILVPFSPETTLSQVGRVVKPDETLWYHTSFTLDEKFNEGKVYLNFGAVDQICDVYLNEELVKHHQGGYLPFSCDITDFLQAENDLVVQVKDYTDTSYYSRGKQSGSRGQIWYTPQSGIWQTVWLESTPVKHIDSLKLTPDWDNASINIEVNGNEESYTYIISNKDGYYKEAVGPGKISIHLEDVRSWSPEDPYLYDLKVKGEKDEVSSYFGMRKFSIEKDNAGLPRIFLNGQPYFCKGVLDQGYWPDSLYTPVSDEEMIYDIQTIKDYGFNTIRKHIKIEPLRYYYLCDKMGIFLWQDMVNGGTVYDFMTTSALPFIGVTLDDHNYKKFSRVEEQSRANYRREMKETVELLYNTVSIGLWVPFNEGWGQFDSKAITEELRQLDKTRLIDAASGWHDQKAGDFNSKHIYFSKIEIKQDERVSILSEYGGYSLAVAGHTYNDANYGYKHFTTDEDLLEGYKQLHEKEVIPAIATGLSATIYTQTSDVEDEINGLMTYDRKVKKFDTQKLKAVNDQLHY